MKNNVKGKITGVINKVSMAAGTAMMTINMGLSSVRAAGLSDYNKASTDGIMGGIKDSIGTIGTYIGGAWAIVAVLTLILAIRNEDNEGRNKALLNLVCAAVLLSFSAIINMFMKDNGTQTGMIINSFFA